MSGVRRGNTLFFIKELDESTTFNVLKTVTYCSILSFSIFPSVFWIFYLSFVNCLTVNIGEWIVINEMVPRDGVNCTYAIRCDDTEHHVPSLVFRKAVTGLLYDTDRGDKSRNTGRLTLV